MPASRILGSERRERLLEALAAEGRVVASEAAERLGVSLDTVRRDLDLLELEGAVRRVHGGALPPSPSPRRFVDREEDDVAAKVAIAEAARGLIASGQVVLLGGGTTVRELARRLPESLEATVVTSAPDVAVALLDHRGLDVVLLGGPVHPETRTVVGGEAVDVLRSLRADLCLLGACSLDAEAGATILHRDEAVVERAMVEQSRRVAVLSAAGKLGSAGPYVVGAPGDVDVLVTDAGIEDARVAAFAARGIEVIHA
jgi:DeoR/GlpR family transcriptional regulator of sugar metabolism